MSTLLTPRLSGSRTVTTTVTTQTWVRQTDVSGEKWWCDKTDTLHFSRRIQPPCYLLSRTVFVSHTRYLWSDLSFRPRNNYSEELRSAPSNGNLDPVPLGTFHKLDTSMSSPFCVPLRVRRSVFPHSRPGRAGSKGRRG